jgi:hypothetical protein
MAASECVCRLVDPGNIFHSWLLCDIMHSPLKEKCSQFQELGPCGAYESTVFWDKIPCSLVFERNVLENQRVNRTSSCWFTQFSHHILHLCQVLQPSKWGQYVPLKHW